MYKGRSPRTVTVPVSHHRNLDRISDRVNQRHTSKKKNQATPDPDRARPGNQQRGHHLSVGFCSSRKRSVSCTQQHLSASTVIVSPCFFPRTPTKTINFISATKLPLPRSLLHASARGAVHIFNNNVPLPTELACGKKNAAHLRRTQRPRCHQDTRVGSQPDHTSQLQPAQSFSQGQRTPFLYDSLRKHPSHQAMVHACLQIRLLVPRRTPRGRRKRSIEVVVPLENRPHPHTHPASCPARRSSWGKGVFSDLGATKHTVQEV